MPIKLRQMPMEIAVRAEFKEGNCQQFSQLNFMARRPPTGNKKRGGDLMLDQETNQRLVKPGFLLDRTHVKGKGDATKLFRCLGCLDLMA